MLSAVLFLHVVTVIVTIVGCSYLATRVFRDRRILPFLAIGVANAGWTLSLFAILTNWYRTDLTGRFSFAFGGVYLVAILWFVMEFPTRVKGWKIWRWIIAISALILGGLPFWPTFLKDVRVKDGAILATWDQTTYPVWTLVFLVILFAPFIALLVRRAKAVMIDQLRINQIFSGFLLMFIPQVITNLVMPLAFQDFRWNNLGPVFTVLMLPFMANAIMRYRLLDVRWIISKSLIFSAVIAFVVWVLMAVSYLFAKIISPQAAFVIGTFVVALVIVPISKAIEQWIGKIFESGNYDPNELMDEVFEIARSEIDVNVIAAKMLSRCMSAFGAESGAFVVFAPKSTRQIASTVKGFAGDFQTVLPSLVSLVKRHDGALLESAELEWNLQYSDEGKRHPEDRRALTAMQKAKMDLLVPLMMEDRVVALLTLGERKYDRVLRQSDVNFVNLLRAGIAPAVENASKFAEMQELYAKLKESDIVKSQFIDTISHQFRTPLSSMRWNVETLLETANDIKEEEKGMLREMETNAYFLIRTLTVFADVIQFESDAVLLEKVQFASSELHDVMTHHEAKAKAKNVVLASDIQPATLVGDKKYIMRAIEEVMENAIEYSSEKAKVTLRVVPVDGKVKVEVTDTGIGMTDVDLKKRAFTKFYRGKNAILAHPDGIGLGLYLVKLITNKLGGSVAIDSELGKGTTVTMMFTGVKKLSAPAPKPTRTRTRVRAK